MRAVSAPTISAGFCARSGGTRKAIDTPAVCETFLRAYLCGRVRHFLSLLRCTVTLVVQPDQSV